MTKSDALNNQTLAWMASIDNATPVVLLASLRKLMNNTLPETKVLMHTHYATKHTLLDLVLPLIKILTVKSYKRSNRNEDRVIDENVIDIEEVYEETDLNIQKELVVKLVTLACHSCRTNHFTVSHATLTVICDVLECSGIDVRLCNETVFYACDERHEGRLKRIVDRVLRKRNLGFIMFDITVLESVCSIGIEGLFRVCTREEDNSRMFSGDEKVLNHCLF